MASQTYFRETAGRWARAWMGRLKDRMLACNRVDCSRSHRAWHRISNGAGSLHLNGLRYCFSECFEQELTRRLEEAQANSQWNPRPPHRVPLGLLMLSRGDLDPEQLRQALAAQRENGAGRIGEWIEKLGYAREHQVTSALATQWACPILRRLPVRAVDCGVPHQLLKRFHMVPVHFSRAAHMLHIAFSGDIEYPVLLAIEQMLECKTAPCLAPSAAIGSVLARMDEEERKPEKFFDGLRCPDEMARITSSYAARLGGQQVRIVVCGDYFWIRIESQGDSTNLLFTRTTAESAPRWEALQRPPAGQATHTPQPAPQSSANTPSAETSPPRRLSIYPPAPVRRSP
jgi:hypothetical protein